MPTSDVALEQLHTILGAREMTAQAVSDRWRYTTDTTRRHLDYGVYIGRFIVAGKSAQNRKTYAVAP